MNAGFGGLGSKVRVNELRCKNVLRKLVGGGCRCWSS